MIAEYLILGLDHCLCTLSLVTSITLTILVVAFLDSGVSPIMNGTVAMYTLVAEDGSRDPDSREGPIF